MSQFTLLTYQLRNWVHYCNQSNQKQIVLEGNIIIPFIDLWLESPFHDVHFYDSHQSDKFALFEKSDYTKIAIEILTLNLF